MIFIKWIKYSASHSETTGPQCAPNLLIELIDMFFFSTQSSGAGNACLMLYPGQPTVQIILILIALLSIPVMLLVKPILAYLDHKKKSQVNSLILLFISKLNYAAILLY